MKSFTLHLREVRVVPVLIEAENLEEAKEILREGGGDYQNESSYPSDLSFIDLSNNELENGFEDGKEIHWKILNEDWWQVDKARAVCGVPPAQLT